MEKRIDEIFSKMRKCKNKQLILVLKELIDLSKKPRYEKLILQYLENEKNLKTFGKCIEKCKIMHGGAGEGEGEGEGEDYGSCPPDQTDTQCSICLLDFTESDDDENVTPCINKHRYHKKCINTWISRQVCGKPEGTIKPSCPLCREVLQPYYLQEKQIFTFDPPIINKDDRYAFIEQDRGLFPQMFQRKQSEKQRTFIIHDNFKSICYEVNRGTLLQQAVSTLRLSRETVQTMANELSAEAQIRLRRSHATLSAEAEIALRTLKREVGIALLLGAGISVGAYEGIKHVANNTGIQVLSGIVSAGPSLCALRPISKLRKYLRLRSQYRELQSIIIDEIITPPVNAMDTAPEPEALTTRIRNTVSSLLPQFMSRNQITPEESGAIPAARRILFENRVAPTQTV
jgi:hypothetical protein